MNELALTLRQVRYESKSFWRNPASVFFTFAFPLMFLVIFDLLFGDDRVEIPGGRGSMMNFYVPAIIALSVVSACYTNVAITTTFSRDLGILKRTRGTPLPGWSYLLGRVLHSTLIGILLVAIVTVAGTIFYGVDLPTSKVPAGLLTIAVAAATFSALGLSVTSVIPNAEASPAIVNGIVLPTLFISDVFIPDDQAPEWLRALATFFPIKHLSEAMQTVFSPLVDGSGFQWDDIAVITAWGVAGVFLASRYFSWEPRR